MADKESGEVIIKTLEELNNIHYKSGPIHQRIERFKALNCIKTNELEAIYHLVESHVPGLRVKTVLRYEKILTATTDNTHSCLSKSHVASHCTNTKVDDNIVIMLGKLKEMPSEWTIVQLTPSFNPKENVEINMDKYYTNSLYISVFNCGVNQPKPFCVYIKAPKDAVNNSHVELVHEMQSIISSNRNTLVASKGQVHFKGVPEKQNYFATRQSIDNRLKMLVKDLQEVYLKEWRCLLIGKYINNELESNIQKRIEEFLKNEFSCIHFDDKTRNILHYLVKGSSYLKLTELRRSVQSILPINQDKNLQKKLVHFIRDLSEELLLPQQKRHPLILVIDDSLDCFPWEMMDVFNDSPVSRLPSLHLAYALFKEHEATIKNGFKIVESPQNGTFIVNPDLDLTNMQNRITSFFEYWTPNWKGISGSKPTEEQFKDMLIAADIFSYNGHGSGTHYFSMEKIEKVRIKAIVLLFGCGSTKLARQGPQTEMFGTHQTYLIACSPCTIGMLWEVTDLDTDILTTELLSQWIPNFDRTHWKFLDKTRWKKGEKVDFTSDSNEIKSSVHSQCEPELLRALSLAKKSNLLTFYITRAACVARGIPVKIV